MYLSGKKVLIVGLAKSGIASARFLSDNSALVTVTDIKGEGELREEIARLDGLDIRYRLGEHTESDFEDSDLIVVSPGVPSDIAPLLLAKEKGVKVISEIELAFRYLDIPIIAITGTNGKSTVTTLVGEIIKRMEMNIFVGGNLGRPISEAIIKENRYDLIVAEVSSFQLEGIEEFRPYIGVILNITPDHMDRYMGMDEYTDAKLRIFMNQDRDDYTVINADDPISERLMSSSIRSRIVSFSREKTLEEGVYIEGDHIVSNLGGDTFPICKLDELKIRGLHNCENILAASAISLLWGCDRDLVREAVLGFSSLEHRMEFVREIKGVKFFNDSKGTNVGAVIKSLSSFSEPIILIAGGRDKGSDFKPLREIVSKKVKNLILIGEASAKMKDILSDCSDIDMADSLSDAVLRASGYAKEGDIVLLSPACASFDMFRDFEERGRIFKDIVNGL
ncbi:MAG: UDP-N-acetylmuramoyl-L-alanine--D-glutamate ligase [Nitrospirota bacterium]